MMCSEWHLESLRWWGCTEQLRNSQVIDTGSRNTFILLLLQLICQLIIGRGVFCLFTYKANQLVRCQKAELFYRICGKFQTHFTMKSFIRVMFQLESLSFAFSSLCSSELHKRACHGAAEWMSFQKAMRDTLRIRAFGEDLSVCHKLLCFLSYLCTGSLQVT